LGECEIRDGEHGAKTDYNWQPGFHLSDATIRTSPHSVGKQILRQNAVIVAFPANVQDQNKSEAIDSKQLSKNRSRRSNEAVHFLHGFWIRLLTSAATIKVEML